MGLASIVGFYLLSLGWGSAQAPSTAAAAQSQAQAPQTESAPAAKSDVQAKPPRHHKKTVPPNCISSPTTLNPTISNSDPAKPTAGASSDVTAHNPSSGQPEATDAAAKSSGAATPASAALPPCPPPKKVVRDGGSSEPAIQLVGGTNAEQAAHQHSTDQLTSATEDNLKKVAGRQLTASQEETVSQIKQFLQQSKTAVAAGDLERGQNLAQKAHLLSEELVKP